MAYRATGKKIVCPQCHLVGSLYESVDEWKDLFVYCSNCGLDEMKVADQNHIPEIVNRETLEEEHLLNNESEKCHCHADQQCSFNVKSAKMS